MKNILAFILILSLPFISVSEADEDALRFVLHNLHVSKFEADGFEAPGVVHTAFKDSRGRLWIGSELGLFLFDGNGTHLFDHERDNIKSLPHGFVKALDEADDGTIWIGTWGGGLAKFNEATRAVERVEARTQTGEAAFDNKVWSFEIDPSGRLWIGTFTTGLFRFDPASGEMVNVYFDPDESRNNRIETIYADGDNQIWFSSWENGLHIIDRNSFDKTIDIPVELQQTGLATIRPFANGQVLLADKRDDAVYLVDKHARVHAKLELGTGHPDDNIMRATPIGNSEALIATGGNGLWYANFEDKTLLNIPSGDHPGAVERTILWDVRQAEDGDIVLAGHGGVALIPAISRQFWTVSGFKAGDPFFLSETRAIERHGNQLFLNNDQEIYQLEFDGTLNHPRELKGSLFVNTVGRALDMKLDRDGNFWITTERDIFHVRAGGGAPVAMGSPGAPHTLARTAEETVVFPLGDQLQTLFPKAVLQIPENATAIWPAQTIGLGRHGDAWIGTFSGIARYSLEDGRPLQVFAPDSDRQAWKNPYTTFLHPVGSSALLIGGKDGVWRAELDRSGAIASIRNAFSGHPFESLSFSAVMRSRNGVVLLFGEPGLVEYDLNTGSTRSLSVDEGVPYYGIYLGDFHQWSDDVAIFSGNKGPLLFDSSSIDFNAPPRQILVTDVRSFRSNNQISWPINKESLRFEYDDRVVRFQFGILDYLNPMNNEYFVRLQGYQDEWISLGRMREFSFTNLPANEYILDIRVDEGSTGKSDQTSIAFKVLPPWWRTWWAYSLYVLIIFGSLFLYWLSLQRKIVREQEISTRLREADRIKSHFLNELESKVEDATQDLRHAVEALEIKNIELGATQQRAIDASRLKSEFLANMSHEIRTPMNGVLGFTQLLQKSALDNDQRDYVETIDKSAKSLLGIINDVLDVSKIEAGKLIIDSSGFDLRECVADTLQALAPVAYDKNLELIGHVDDSLPDKLRSDPTRLRQMLTNLVGNAIKFTDSGHVYVHVEKANSGDGEERLRISVSDTGRGISAEDREKLFHAFERGSVDLAGRYTGTGLGLVITKKLCEAMGGNVELDSVPGKGTQVVLELPLVVDRNPENRYGFGKPLQGRRIVIIDPHTQSREAFRSRLAHWGAGVTALADVIEPAMNDADLVIFGVERIRLGDTRGLEALHRKLPKNVPGLCMAASVDRDALRSLAKVSGAPCIPKVGHLESQLRRICEALGIGMDAAQVEETAPGRLAGLHVLVADDNRINRYFLKKILELHGARVTEVDSGQGVLRTLDSLDDKIDIALLDVHMPDIDGLEVARRIRARGNHKLPLLAVSANVQTETHEAAIAAGINDYLLKPVEEMKLVEAVLEWTGREETVNSEQ